MIETQMKPIEYCRNKLVNPSHIPDFLQSLPHWVVWKAFNERPDGRFDKVPVCPRSGYKVNALDKSNHMSFEEALQAHQSGSGDGIGISLTGKPVTHNLDGEPLYLIGVDLDKVLESEKTIGTAKTISKSIGSYCEVSPSGTGIRIFALSEKLVGNGQSPNGEMYNNSRFLTVTGHGPAHDVVNATDQLKVLESKWWPVNKIDKATSNISGGDSPNTATFRRALYKADWPENEKKVSEVLALLDWVSPATDHEVWRDIIWAIASLKWGSGKQILLNWSKGDLIRWATPEGALAAEEYLHNLYEAFDTERNFSIGTLFYHAERFGRPKVAFEYRKQIYEEELPTGKHFNILSRDDLRAMPPAEWLVRGILPTTGVATIFGPSMSGKSFIAIDLAIAITNGDGNWFNRYLLKRPGLYVALEGGAGIKKRIDAWEKHHKKTAPDLKYIIDQFSILDKTHVSNLIAQIGDQVGDGAVIFIDTLSQATAGSDENSSIDMGLILEAAQLIAKRIKGLVILIHHTGKDASKGARGHSSFHAAMESAIEVSRKDQIRYWKTAKVKDGDDTIKEAFELQVVELGNDQFGHPDTSCAIKPRSVIFSAVKPKGKNQQVALETITKLLIGKKEVTGAEVEDAVKSKLTEVKKSHRATRTKEAIKGLATSGFINITGGAITLPQNTGSSP